ncbi:MAG: hypothetical protein U9Q05_02360 [Thermodesulfobacteriota bacterium]|nr:hypothetical protein [Thermodesulfobacteriota bacterium]
MKKSKTISKLALVAMFIALVTMASNAHAVDGSIQALGGWWDAGDSGDTYGLGLRGSLGSGAWTADLGWMSYGEGDDIEIDIIDYEKELGGIKANVFDFGLRYTFPMELYIGGGLSYFDFDHDVESIDGEWGAYGLVGWSFGGEHIRVFIEGMYRYTEGTIKYDHGFEGHFERDIDHDGFGANIGIMYRF